MSGTKITIFILNLIILSILFSCGPTEQDESYDRVAFYFAGVEDNASENEYGLFRYYMGEDFEERVAVYPLKNTTCLSDNGKILFEYGEGVDTKLWKKCLFGPLMEIPLPPADESGSYSYSDKACLPMSSDSYHLSYFAAYEHDNNGNKEYRLVCFHWCERDFCVPDLTTFLNEKFPEYSIDGFIPAGENLAMSFDGSSVYLTVIATSYGNPATNVCLKYSNGDFKVLNESVSEIMEIAGYDQVNDNVIIISNGEIYKISEISGVDNLEIGTGLIENPAQFTRKKAQLVVFEDGTIRLYSADNGSLIKDVVSYDEINVMYPNYKNKADGKLSVSPSGDWIIFALERKDRSNRYGLFTIRTDGSKLRLLKEDIALDMPLISDYIEVQR